MEAPSFESNQENFGAVAKAFGGEAIRVLLLSGIIVFTVRYFLIQPFNVIGASMEPNFYNKEYLVIDEISYRFTAPRRGEVVVFHPPGSGRQSFIKRVIGLPGETVTISRGAVRIENVETPDGFTLDETAYLPGVATVGDLRVTLDTDEYFLLGDNRASSLDSRSFGPVHRSSIIGRVWVRGWPIEKIGAIKAPTYQGGGIGE